MSARLWLRDRPGSGPEAARTADVALQSGGSAKSSATQKGKRTPKKRPAASPSKEEVASSPPPRGTLDRRSRRWGSPQDARSDVDVAREEEAVRDAPGEEGGGAGHGDAGADSKQARAGSPNGGETISPWEGVVLAPHGSEGQVSGVALALGAQGGRQGRQEEHGQGVDVEARAAGGRTLAEGGGPLVEDVPAVVGVSHEGPDVLDSGGATGQPSEQAETTAASQSSASAPLAHRATRPDAPAAAPSAATASSSVAAAGAAGERAASVRAAGDAAEAVVSPGPAEAEMVDLTGDDEDDVAEVGARLPSRSKRRHGAGHPASQGRQLRGGPAAGSPGTGGRLGGGSGARASLEVVDLDQDDDDCEVVFATTVRCQKRRVGGNGARAGSRDGGAAGVGAGTQIFIIMDSPEDLRQAAAASLAAGGRASLAQQQGAASRTHHRPPHPDNGHRSHVHPTESIAAHRPVPSEPGSFLGRDGGVPTAQRGMPAASHCSGPSGSGSGTQSQGTAGLGSRWQFPGASTMAGGAASLFSAAAAAAASANFGAAIGASGRAGQGNQSLIEQSKAPLPFGNGLHGSPYAQGRPESGGARSPFGVSGTQPRPGEAAAAGLPQEQSPSEVGVGLNIKCPICLDKISEEATTTCGHLFCKPCIALAVRTKKCCPTCRRKLGKSGYHRVYLS